MAAMPDTPTTPDAPWQGDACSLVDAFRAGERSPVEELEATLAAIGASDLNAFAHVDPDRARAAAAAADVSLPFGGVPTGIKELEPVAGWPWTEASLVHEGRVAATTSHHIERLLGPGRHRAGRRHDGQRVRRPQRERHEDQRRHPQPVAPRPHGRRLVLGVVGGGGRRPGQPGDGRRRRRVDPHPCRLHRPARDEGHVRPHPRGRGRSCGPTRSCSATCPARCATPPATTTCAPAPTATTPAACRRPAGGRPTSAPTTCGRARSRSCPASAACPLEPGVEDRIREEAKALVADDRHGRGRPGGRAAQPAGPVDDGQPGHAARRPRRRLAAVRRPTDRRDGDRPAPGPVALQPRHRRGRRGAADRGQRGHGPRVLRGRLRDRRHQPGAGVRGRGGDQQRRRPARSTSRCRARSARRRRPRRWGRCGSRRRRSPGCRHASWPRRPNACPTSSTWAG